MEKTMMSLSSPWTFSMFLTNNPTSSPFSLRPVSLRYSSLNPGSEEHLSSSMLSMRSICALLNVMIPTVSSPFVLRMSDTRSTTLSASGRLHLSAHLPPSTLCTEMGGSGSGSRLGDMHSLPS